jgi:hypothetical protein
VAAFHGPPSNTPLARLLRFGLLAIGCACAAWAAWILAFGGVTLVLFGIRVRSHAPGRAALIGLVALAGFVLAGGAIPLRAAVARAKAFAAVLAAHPLWIACLLALAVGVAGMRFSTRIAGGSDAYGYVSQADLWLRGDLHVEQPWVADAPWPNKEWTFTPVGYRPAARGAIPSIVPTYSPGLPLILSLATLVGGHCAMFAVVPLCSGLAILCTYGIGRRAGSSWSGVVAGWFVATSPAVLSIMMEPLTDVPVMTAWSASIFFALGSGSWSALAAGAASALAILIRPNLVPLAGPMFLWLLVRRGPADRRWQTRLVDAALFGAAALAGIIGVAAINRTLYGSSFTSGYGRLEDQFAWIHIVPNIRRFVTWFVETQSPLALLGIVALVTPSSRVWPRLPDRSVLALFAAFVIMLWAEYSAYLEFDSWGYLRFLLPSWPLVMLGLAASLLAIGRLSIAGARLLASATIVLLGIWGLQRAATLGAFNQRQAARHEAIVAAIVREHTGPESVVFASGRSGSLRYYGGRMTARYDLLPEDWLDRAVTWMTERGAHVYLLLDRNEFPEFRSRFAGQRTQASLASPLLVYEPGDLRLFDLSSPPEQHRTPFIISRVPPDPGRCEPRAAMPSFAWQPFGPRARLISSDAPGGRGCRS